MGKLTLSLKSQRRACPALRFEFVFSFISNEGIGEDGGCGNCEEAVKLAIRYFTGHKCCILMM